MLSLSAATRRQSRERFTTKRRGRGVSGAQHSTKALNGKRTDRQRQSKDRAMAKAEVEDADVIVPLAWESSAFLRRGCHTKRRAV